MSALLGALEFQVSTETRKQHTHTCTHNTHVVTRGTRSKRARSTRSPPRVPGAVCRREQEQGFEAHHLPAFGRRQTLTIN